MTSTESVAASALNRRLRAASLVLAACALALLAGCTTGSRGTADTFRLLFNRGVHATPEQVAAVPYPQVQLKANDLSSVSVLGFVDKGRLSWYASNHAVFYTNEVGLLIGTSGLGRSYEARIIGASPFNDLASLSGPTTVHRQYDWLPSYQMGVAVTGTLQRGRQESVEILGQARQLVRFEERLEGPGLNETNLYWADPESGFIWKSRQYLAPGYAVELIQLKPYRPARS